MSEVPFHMTRRGKVFLEHTVPELVRQLTRLNEHLDALVARLEANDGSDEDGWPVDDPEAS